MKHVYTMVTIFDDFDCSILTSGNDKELAISVFDECVNSISKSALEIVKRYKLYEDEIVIREKIIERGF